MRRRIGASLVYVMLLSLTQCRAQEPAPTPAPAATVVPVASTTPQETPMPTPTPTLDPPRPLELVVPTAVPPLMETPTLTPTPPALSSMDERLAQDAQRLQKSLDAVVQDADALDELFSQYVTSCFQKYTTQKWQPPTGLEAPYRRHWVTILDPEPTVFFRQNWREQPVAIVVWPVERCEALWDDLAKKAPTIFPRVDALSEEARRAGVLPGNLRTLLKKHRLVR
jgi:hypothetical protein